jgi:O-methyltransferase
VVKAGERDRVYRGGEHDDATPDAVRDLAARFGLSNVKILKGVFPDDTGSGVADRVFKFAHIDVDVYEGARDVFEWLLPRVVVGGIVVFDDYGSCATDGVRVFVDEIQGSADLAADLAIVHNLNGQAVVVRRAGTTVAPREVS